MTDYFFRDLREACLNPAISPFNEYQIEELSSLNDDAAFYKRYRELVIELQEAEAQKK